jgi:hypothetical protein
MTGIITGYWPKKSRNLVKKRILAGGRDDLSNPINQSSIVKLARKSNFETPCNNNSRKQVIHMESRFHILKQWWVTVASSIDLVLKTI